MKKGAKIWLFIASFLVLIGLVFTFVMANLNWDFTKVSTVKFQTKEYEIDKNFSNLAITTDTADIIFALSDDGICRVECFEGRKEPHLVKVENDTLNITLINNRAWYDYIGISFSSPKITLYLPKANYADLNIKADTSDVFVPKDFSFKNADISVSTGDVNYLSKAENLVKIKTSTGNIRLENMAVGSLDLSTSTGNINLSHIDCKKDARFSVSTGNVALTNLLCDNLYSFGSTGNIALRNVTATGSLTIERSTGDVSFDSSDAVKIFVKTDTGNVLGHLLSEKVFIVKTDTGKVSVPSTDSGGRCEITTDTGNIKITLP